MGAFMLGRPGLYARQEVGEDGQIRLFLLFKGNDLHSGTAPSVNAEEKQAFLDKLSQEYLRVDETNRVVYVCYPSFDATERTVPVASSAPTGLGNDTVVGDGVDSGVHNFARDGTPALGTPSSLRTRLRWEQYYRMWNASVQFGVIPDDFNPVTNLCTGSFEVTPLPPLHPLRDATHMNSMRSLYRRYHNDCEVYKMSITKSQYRTELT